MKRLRSERGATLIMLMGVVAVLAVLATALVMATGNMQGATKGVTDKTKAFNVAEAGLDSALYSMSAAWPSTQDWTFSATGYDTSFPAADYPRPKSGAFVDVVAYDNAPYTSPYSASNPPHLDANNDGIMWVECQANVQDRSARLRSMVKKQNVPIPTPLQGVAMYSGGDTSLTGSQDFLSTMNGANPTGAVYIYGNMTMTGSQSFSAMGLKVKGTLSAPGSQTFSPIKTQNDATVPTFDQFMSADVISSLTTAAKATQPSGIVVPNNGTLPQNPGTAVHVTGSVSVTGSGTYTIPALYVDGNFSSTGSAKFDIGALYVGSSVSMTGSGGIKSLGPAWVGGDATLTGSGTVSMPLFVCGGNVSLTGSSDWGGPGTPPTPCVVMTTGAGKNVTKAGSGKFYGLLACTQGSVSNTGSGDFYGCVLSFGPVVNWAGSSKLTYDGNLITVTTQTTVTIARLVPDTWQQIKTQ